MLELCIGICGWLVDGKENYTTKITPDSDSEGTCAKRIVRIGGTSIRVLGLSMLYKPRPLGYTYNRWGPRELSNADKKV